nr:hypothetical protein CFP56_48858 [Quercus suber]
MGRHCFYVYYDGEKYFHDLHRLSYRGESVKQKFIELKCGTYLIKMHRKIMEALGLDKESHKISIVYLIKQTPQFIASDLYVIVKAIGFHAGASSQHGNGVAESHSSSLDVQPSFANATPLPYNNQPCSVVNDFNETKVLGTTHTHDVGGSSHTYEHVQADMDGGIDIDGPVDDAEVLDVPLIENN